MTIRKLAIPSIVALAAFCMLVSLGVWQVKRLYWKEELIATVERRIKQEPVPFVQFWANLNPGKANEYVPVSLRGSFLHQYERHYYATFNGEAGWHVFTPFEIEDGSIIFVNRGFVPYDMKDASTRKNSLIEGEVEVSGLIRVPPDSKPNIFTPENDTIGNQFYWRDLEVMISSSGLPTNQNLIPLFVDSNSSLPDEFPIAGTTQVKFPNNHLQYAGTWFGLAIVLAVVFFFFARSRLKHGNGE